MPDRIAHASRGNPDTTTEPQVDLQSYLRFRDLLEAAPNAIFEVEHDGTIVLLNAAAERMFGYAREELLGQIIEVLVPESLRPVHREHRGIYAAHPVTRPMGILCAPATNRRAAPPDSGRGRR